MRTTLHPEYPAYLHDKEVFHRCRAALARWESSGKPLFVKEFSLTWMPDGVRDFTRSLSRFIQTYNQVLWEQFPYCPRCLGQCCGRNAATVGLFDLLALTFLDLNLPELPERIAANSQDCIYQTPQGCAWPEGWRTQKCWLFYCLGPSEKDEFPGKPYPSIGKRYSDLANALGQATAGMLPKPLLVYERVSGTSFREWLEKPLSFSRVLTQALLHIFTLEFNRLYPMIDPGTIQSQLEAYDPEQVESWVSCVRDERGLESIEAAIQAALDHLPARSVLREDITHQLTDDLETLEWIVLGWPENSDALLENIHQRYSRADQPTGNQLSELCTRIRDISLHLQQNADGIRSGVRRS